MTDVRDRRDGKRSPPRSGTGREELRSTWFRPYLLRLRAERGDAALRALLSTLANACFAPWPPRWAPTPSAIAALG
jgi:hypothetical protein